MLLFIFNRRLHSLRKTWRLLSEWPNNQKYTLTISWLTNRLNCLNQANTKGKDLQLKRAAETIAKLKTQLQESQLNLQVWYSIELYWSTIHLFHVCLVGCVRREKQMWGLGSPHQSARETTCRADRWLPQADETHRHPQETESAHRSC